MKEADMFCQVALEQIVNLMSDVKLKHRKLGIHCTLYHTHAWMAYMIITCISHLSHPWSLTFAVPFPLIKFSES